MQKEDEAKTEWKTTVGNTQLHVYKSLGQPRGGGYVRLVRKRRMWEEKRRKVEVRMKRGVGLSETQGRMKGSLYTFRATVKKVNES